MKSRFLQILPSQFCLRHSHKAAIMIHNTHSFLVRYGVAVATVALALLLTLALWPVTDHAPFAFSFAAVMVSAWYGGLGPGLCAIALAVLGSIYFLLPPFHSFFVDRVDNLIRLGLFVLVALLINVLNAQRRRAEENERAQREYFQVTLASIGDAVIVTDAAGSVTFLNRIAEDLTGWPVADAVDKPLPEVFHIINEQTRQPVENPVAKVLRTGAVAGLANHTVLIRKDGSVCPIDDSAAPIHDARGRVLGVILVFRDISERRQAEQALQGSRDQLAVILQGIADGITAQDLTGRLLYANETAARILGYPSTQALLQAPLRDIMQQFEVLDEEGRPFPLAQLPGRKALQGELHPEALLRFRIVATGEERWSQVKATPIMGEKGTVQFAVNIFHDITVLKQAEEELRRSETRYRTVSELVSDYAYAVRIEPDGRGVLEWVTEAFSRITGFTTSELTAREGLAWLIHPEDFPSVQRRLQALFEGLPGSSEHRILTKSGEVRWLRDYSAPEWDPTHSRLVRIVGAGQDITVRKQAEEVSLRLAAIVASSDDAIVSKSLDGTVTSWNAGAERLFGYQAAEMIGHSIRRLLPDDRQDEEDMILERLRRGEQVDHFETVRRTKDGRLVDVSVTTSPLRDTHGVIIGASKIARDITARKQAEEALAQRAVALQEAEEAERAQREYFQVTLASIGDAVIVTDPTGIVTFLNAVAEAVTGWATADAVGKPLPEVFHIVNEETRQPVENPVAKVLRTGTVAGLANHTVLIRKDGTVCPIDDSAAPIRDAQNRILGVILVCRDITERRQAEDALRRWQYIFDHAGWAVVVADPQTNTVQMANPAFARMHGYTVDDLIGRPLADIFAPEARAGLPAHVTAAHEQGDYEYEAQHLRADGSTFPALTHVTALKDETGRVLLRAATVQDLTVRKQVEAERQRANALLQAVSETTADLIFVKDRDHRLLFGNPSLFRTLGKTPEEIIGLSEPEWYQDLDQANTLVATDRRVMTTARPATVEETVTTPAGLRTFLSTKAPYYDAQGTVIGLVGVATDITARKEAEAERERLLAELQRINAEFQQFAHIVSHDLSEPLRTMRSYIQLLAQRTQGTLAGEATEYMDFVTDAAQRMQQMLTDLLAYTRAGQTPEFSAVDCEVVLAQVLSALQTRITECEAVITHDPLPTIQGDATRLGQVLQNLIGNALKFCDEKPPRVHISAVQEAQHWQFSVRDNGIGIDPQQTGKLFQVFQRLHSRNEYAGTGIGLAICKRIVEQHGGRIWVESKPREGSIFHFTIKENK
jgi:PAS domain S-box-containing protein